MKSFRACLFLIVLIAVSCTFTAAEEAKAADKATDKPAWAKKDILDYNDADMERLLEQWDENDEEKEEEPKAPPPPPIDITKLGTSDTESMLRASKKGRTLMSFVALKSESREQTDVITGIWQTSLQNNHLHSNRFLIENDRAIFMFDDGDHAWDAKDFFIKQPECIEVTIEGQSYYGPAYVPEEKKPDSEPEEDLSDLG